MNRLRQRYQRKALEAKLQHVAKTESETKIIVSGTDVHEEIQRLLESQIKLQKEMFKSRERTEKPKSSSVKLSKLEINEYRGDKIRWTEFLQSFECSVHRNENLSNIVKLLLSHE